MNSPGALPFVRPDDPPVSAGHRSVQGVHAPLRLAGVMKVRRLSIARLGKEDLVNWRALVASTAEANPCYEPEFLCPAAAALGPAAMDLVIVTERGKWRAMVPVRRVWHVGRSPVPAVAAWRHQLSFLETPLVDASAIERSVAKMVHELARPAMGAGFVLDRMADGPVARAMIDALAPSRRGVISRTFVRPAAYPRAPSGKTPIDDAGIQLVARRLERDVGPVTVVETVADHAAVDRFLEMQRTSLGSTISYSPAQMEFFKRMCRGFADRGRLQILALESRNAVLAMKLNVVTGDTVFHLKAAQAGSLAVSDAARLLEISALTRFPGNDQISMLDPAGAASSAHIDDLWPDRLEMMSLIIPSSSAARAAFERRAGRPRRNSSPASDVPPSGTIHDRGRRSPGQRQEAIQ